MAFSSHNTCLHTLTLIKIAHELHKLPPRVYLRQR